MDIVSNGDKHALLKAFADSARDFLQKISPTERIRTFRGKTPNFENSVWQELASAGWNGLLIDEDDGGLGLGVAELSAIAGEIGRQLMPEPFLAGAIMPSALLSVLPDSPIRTQLNQAIASGEMVLGIARQTQMGSSDLSNHGELEIVDVGSHLRLSGTFKWV